MVNVFSSLDGEMAMSCEEQVTVSLTPVPQGNGSSERRDKTKLMGFQPRCQS